MRRHSPTSTKFRLCKINEFWRFDVDRGGGGEQHRAVYLKFANRLDLKLHTHTRTHNGDYVLLTGDFVWLG